MFHDMFNWYKRFLNSCNSEPSESAIWFQKFVCKTCIQLPQALSDILQTYNIGTNPMGWCFSPWCVLGYPWKVDSQLDTPLFSQSDTPGPWWNFMPFSKVMPFGSSLTSQHLMFAPWSLVLLLKEVLLVPKCRVALTVFEHCHPCRRNPFPSDLYRCCRFSINSVTPDKLRCPTYWMLAPTGCVCVCFSRTGALGHATIGIARLINKRHKSHKIWTCGGCRSNPGDIVLPFLVLLCAEIMFRKSTDANTVTSAWQTFESLGSMIRVTKDTPPKAHL